MEEKKEFKHLVRIANTDLNGARPIEITLRQIKGIDFMFSNVICHLAKIDRKKRVGDLDEEEQKRIDAVIKDPSKYSIPSWMFNRRKDIKGGTDKHIIGVDLSLIKDNDIKTMKKIKCYRGVRHILNQPVRGQRTKGNFRENKGKVHLGVKKKPGAKTGRP